LEEEWIQSFIMRNDLRAGIEHIEYFKTIPWCAEIINNPSYASTPTSSRVSKASTEDSFFAETLQTERTLRKCLTLSAKPDDSLNLPIQEILVFYELGNGVNGFPNTAHGGFIATLLDEEMGILINTNHEYANKKSGRNDEISSMTAYLNMKYMVPVKTPGILLGRAKVVRTEQGRRKIWIRGTIEDKSGKELAEAECLFVKPRNDPRANL